MVVGCVTAVLTNFVHGVGLDDAIKIVVVIAHREIGGESTVNHIVDELGLIAFKETSTAVVVHLTAYHAAVKAPGDGACRVTSAVTKDQARHGNAIIATFAFGDEDADGSFEIAMPTFSKNANC